MDALEQLISAQTAAVEEAIRLLNDVKAKLESGAPTPEAQHSALMAGKLRDPLTALWIRDELWAAELAAIKADADAEAFRRGYEAGRGDERPALRLAVP